MILSNGLLATAALCGAPGDGDKRGDMKKALDATANAFFDRSIAL